MLDAQRAGCTAFADQRIAPHDAMALDEDLAAPFLDVGMHVDALAIRHRVVKPGVYLEQGRTDA